MPQDEQLRTIAGQVAVRGSPEVVNAFAAHLAATGVDHSISVVTDLEAHFPPLEQSRLDRVR